VKSSTVEEDTAVPKPVEASREATELVAAELTAKPTTGKPTAGKVSRSEPPAAKTAEVATRETATPSVSSAKAPAAATHPEGERDAALHCERENDGEAEDEKATSPRRQRPINRRDLHGESLVASSGSVKGGFGVGERFLSRGWPRP
jgi:hypothetical protein